MILPKNGQFTPNPCAGNMDLKILIIFALFCQTFAGNVMPPIPKKADVNKLVYSLNPNSEFDPKIYDEIVKNPKMAIAKINAALG